MSARNAPAPGPATRYAIALLARRDENFALRVEAAWRALTVLTASTKVVALPTKERR